MPLFRFCYFWFFSPLTIFYLVSFATEGDKKGYIAFYEGITNLDFLAAFFKSFSALGSREPFSVFVFWFFSQLRVPQFYFFALLACILFACIYNIVPKHYALFRFFLPFSFYSFVLYISAIRLEISFMFIIFSLLLLNRPYLSKLFLFLGILSHFSSILFIVPALIDRYYNSFFLFFTRLRLKFSTLLTLPFLSAFLLTIFIATSYKISGSFANAQITFSDFNLLSYCLLSFSFLRNNIIKSFFVFSPFFFAILLLDSLRVNILLFYFYFYYLFYCIPSPRVSLALYPLIIYAIFKLFHPLNLLLLHGDMFYSPV